jgi:hypothetical protein
MGPTVLPDPPPAICRTDQPPVLRKLKRVERLCRNPSCVATQVIKGRIRDRATGAIHLTLSTASLTQPGSITAGAAATRSRNAPCFSFATISVGHCSGRIVPVSTHPHSNTAPADADGAGHLGGGASARVSPAAVGVGVSRASRCGCADRCRDAAHVADRASRRRVSAQGMGGGTRTSLNHVSSPALAPMDGDSPLIAPGIPHVGGAPASLKC